MTEITPVIDYIEELAAEGFWGTVTLKFQGGRVFHLTKEESLKPTQLPDHRRKHEGARH